MTKSAHKKNQAQVKSGLRLKPMVRDKENVRGNRQADALQLRHAVSSPGSAPSGLVGLQQGYGNQAVSGLIQAKLRVGAVGDKYEQEADRVAAQVLAMQVPAKGPGTGIRGHSAIQRDNEPLGVQTRPLAASITRLVQRQEEEEEVQMKPLVQRQEEEEELQMKPLVQRQEEEEELQMKPLVQRQEEEEELQMKPLLQRQEEEEELQMKPLLQRKTYADGSFEAGSSLEKRLAARTGGGSPLPDGTRSFMEPRFGTDFGRVRVHTDAAAVQMNSELNAQAFTHGHDIYIRPDKYSPGTEAGNKLLAHELTHVVQQGGARNRIARWGAGLGGYGTSHTTVSTMAYEKMDKDLVNDFGRDALAYLATHSDHMDKRGGYLLPVAKYMTGQWITKKRGKGMYAGPVTAAQIRKIYGKKRAKKGIPYSEILRIKEEEKRKRAQAYDEAEGYVRSAAEAPNHAEGGMYQRMGEEGRDRQRIREYLDNAVSQWWSGNPRQSLYTLALGLHTAQDIGAHGHGAPGTGHDPRRFTRPPNEYTNKGWVYYETGAGKHGEDMNFAFCDNINDNPEGLVTAIKETHKLLATFRARVQGEGGGIKQGFVKPGWFKRQLRGAGRFFFGRGIIKHK